MNMAVSPGSINPVDEIQQSISISAVVRPMGVRQLLMASFARESAPCRCFFSNWVCVSVGRPSWFGSGR